MDFPSPGLLYRASARGCSEEYPKARIKPNNERNQSVYPTVSSTHVSMKNIMHILHIILIAWKFGRLPTKSDNKLCVWLLFLKGQTMNAHGPTHVDVCSTNPGTKSWLAGYFTISPPGLPIGNGAPANVDQSESNAAGWITNGSAWSVYLLGTGPHFPAGYVTPKPGVHMSY